MSFNNMLYTLFGVLNLNIAMKEEPKKSITDIHWEHLIIDDLELIDDTMSKKYIHSLREILEIPGLKTKNDFKDLILCLEQSRNEDDSSLEKIFCQIPKLFINDFPQISLELEGPLNSLNIIFTVELIFNKDSISGKILQLLKEKGLLFIARYHCNSEKGELPEPGSHGNDDYGAAYILPALVKKHQEIHVFKKYELHCYPIIVISFNNLDKFFEKLSKTELEEQRKILYDAFKEKNINITTKFKDCKD